MWRVLYVMAVLYSAEGCPFEESLLGNWTSTNYGKLTFSNSSPHFVMNFGLFDGETSTSFDCLLANETRYVLNSTKAYAPFDNEYQIYLYLCLDLHKVGDYSYYYYQLSAVNSGLKGQRVKPISAVDLSVVEADVCTTSVDIAEFHTMVKLGYEDAAAVQCPDPLLLSGSYTFTDASGTYCDGLNTTVVDTCNQNLTNILFNDSVVDDTACKNKNPGFSADGKLGCVTHIYDSNTTQYYVTLYNYDSTVDSVTTFRFTCAAIYVDENGTVFMSMLPTDCIAGQNPTVLPTNGALMELTPLGVPTTPPEPEKDWTWLIILCVMLFVALVIILVIVLLCLHLKKKQRAKAREKKILITEEHPLAEMSMPIDAPKSMEPVNDTAFFENREDLYRTPRGKTKEKLMSNPMSESSLILDFKSPRWSVPKVQPTAPFSDDPFSEMSNGEIVPISPVGSKTVRSMLNKQRSFSTAFLESNPGPLKNGGLVRHASVGMLSERSFLKSRPTSKGTAAPQTPKTERSFRASSRRSTKVITQSPGLAAMKVSSSAPAPSVISGMRSTRSIKTNKTGKTNAAPSEKPKSGKKQGRARGVVSTKLGRSTTSTKIGSVTHKKNSQNKETMKRSKTVVEPPLSTIARAREGERIENEAMNEFLAAEAGSSVSGPAVSKKASPKRKSILKKKSAYLPLDFEEEQRGENKFPTDQQPSVNHDRSASDDVLSKRLHESPAYLSSSFSERDSFLGLKAKQNSEKTTNTPRPSKAAWR